MITRSSLLTILLLGACGGAPAPVVGGTSDPATRPAPPAPSPGKGTTGVGTLDWGATAAQVTAAFPTAKANVEGGLEAIADLDGMPARLAFRFDATGLATIEVAWTARYADMGACMRPTWTELRAKYDAKFGASQSDNGAAYWKTPTAQIEVACNTDDSGVGTMQATFAPLAAD